MNSNTLQSLIKVSPAVLLISMILSFVVMGALQMFFYADVFSGKFDSGFVYAIAIAICLIVQGARFAFGLAAVNESYHGKYFSMLFGLLFSLGLTIVETYEVAEISSTWDLGNYAHSVTIILFAILWIGFCLELRLILNLAGKGLGKINEDDKTELPTDDNLKDVFPDAENTHKGEVAGIAKYYLDNRMGKETIKQFYARISNPTKKNEIPIDLGKG